MSLVLILRVFLVRRFYMGSNFVQRKFSIFLKNDHDCKVVDPHFFIKKVLDIFENYRAERLDLIVSVK